MSIKFACACGKAYKVPDKLSGKRVKCKRCGEPVRVPSESQAGLTSARASAVSKRSVLASQRLSKSGRSGRSRRTSARLSGRKQRATSGTQRVKAVDLSEGNQLKRYKSKKEEEFRRGEARLTYFENGKPVKAFRVSKKGATIGRSERCGVTIPDDSVSSEHVKIEYKLGTFISTDLQSANGLVVNGRVVRRCSLKNDDIIQLGQAILRFNC